MPRRRGPAELARERFEQPFAHRIYLPDGTIAEETTGPGHRQLDALDEISPYMQVAVLTTEDGGFPQHHGFNRASIRSSIVANLKARRFVRGASTITMQLAKNLFLSRDKTLSRKLEEVVLTDYLEQTFSKDELMELYLNVIEFGPAVYGDHGRRGALLRPDARRAQSGRVPVPLVAAARAVRYGAMRENGEVPGGLDAHAPLPDADRPPYGRITDAELADGEKEPIVFWHGGDRPPPRPRSRADRIRRRLEDVTAQPTSSAAPGSSRTRELAVGAGSSRASGSSRLGASSTLARAQAPRRSAAAARCMRSSSTPSTTSNRWLRRGSLPMPNRASSRAPAFGSAQP